MLSAAQKNHAHVGEQLNIVSPLATLERGFSIGFDCKGDILRSSTQVNKGDEVQIRLAQGRLLCEVAEVLQDND